VAKAMLWVTAALGTAPLVRIARKERMLAILLLVGLARATAGAVGRVPANAMTTV